MVLIVLKFILKLPDWAIPSFSLPLLTESQAQIFPTPTSHSHSAMKHGMFFVGGGFFFVGLFCFVFHSMSI